MKQVSQVYCSTPSRPAKVHAASIMRCRAMQPFKFLAAFVRREEGAVAVVGGLAIPVLLGVAGLALEYGQVLEVRAEAQRTADFASHAGAVAYARTGEIGPMEDAAKGVARLNGFKDSEIAVVLDTSVQSASGAAVRATITTPRPLYLPRFVGGDTSVDVVASAVAGALGGEPACVQAIDPNASGITLSGSTSIQSNDCGVASNAEVTAPCGTSIITKSLSYDSSSAPHTGGCGTIVAPGGATSQITRRPTPDPLAGTDAILLASAQMSRTAALADPDPDLDGVAMAVGPDIEFGWNGTATKAQAEAIGCAATFASSNSEWTFTCPGLSTVNLGNITIGGGLNLRFNPGASQGVVYNLSGSIRNTANRMTFAPGVYNIGQNIITSGNSVTEFGEGTFRISGRIQSDGKRITFGDGDYDVGQGLFTGGGTITEFGAGTYRIGRSDQSCGGARYSICHTGTDLSFNGSSEFVLPGGFWNNGGSVLTLGTGTQNSFRFGPSSDGDAISLGGGSQTFMGDAVGGLFEVAGHIDGGGGGSCLVLPATDLHEIRGSLLASGAIRFGAGLYVIDGYMHLGGNGGGSAFCDGETISVRAIDTTFLISASGAAPGGWECSGQAFCVSAGYSNTRFIAPQSGPFTDLAVIGPLDASRNEGALFAGGADGGIVSGAFYFPNGPVTMVGGASASGGSGGCLQLIGTEISLSGGTSVASECKLPQSGGSGRVTILR